LVAGGGVLAYSLGVIRLFAQSNGKTVFETQSRGDFWVRTLAVSANGELLAVGGMRTLKKQGGVPVSTVGEVILYDLKQLLKARGGQQKK
jgi:hypothetical protein